MADEPASARREPVARRLLRWLTRHRTPVTAAGVALLVALAGTAAVLAVQARANAELKRANVELTIANQRVTKTNADLRAAGERERQRFDVAMEAIKLFHGEVSEDLLLEEKQFARLRGRLLKGAADFYGKLERLLEEQSDPPSRAALGRAYHDLGELTAEIGNTAEALAVHRKGLAVRRELADRPGSDDAAVLDVVRSLYAVGVWLGVTGDAAGSVTSWEEALRLAEGLIAAGRGADEARFELARCACVLCLKVGEDRPDEGLAMAHHAEATLRELVAKAPSETRYLEGLGRCLMSTSVMLGARDLLAESLAAEEESMATFRKLADAQPEVHRFQDLLAIQHNNIASSYWGLGQQDAAIASVRRAVAIWRKAADANPAVTGVANDLAFGLNHLADDLIAVGRSAEALEWLFEARSIFRRLVAADSGAQAPARNLAGNYTRTGMALARMGMWREAEEAFEEALSIYRDLDDQPSNKGHRVWEPYGLSRLGWSLWKAGRAAEAASAFGQECAIRQRLAAAGPASAADRKALAVCESNGAAALLSLGRLAEARACCDRAIAIGERLLQGDPEKGQIARLLAVILVRSGSVRAAAGDPAGAAADWRRAAALYASHPPLEPQAAIARACCHGGLAGLAGQEGSGISPAEAAAQAEEAMTILRRAVAGGYRDFDLLRVEPGLDPLRSRDDFRRLLMDLTFPAEPFAVRLDADFRPMPDPR
jgi:tetratricopeptide (TPR) repeat protein